MPSPVTEWLDRAEATYYEIDACATFPRFVAFAREVQALHERRLTTEGDLRHGIKTALDKLTYEVPGGE